ncbi:hypothetical protein HanRHA438_Chr09g0412181 [Helianthus annuus]|nr:hypothetical protein HanIR_Chr09g0431291 [Helianthus annuus]KAJ0889374.1 hypothetical protein HanRHA438_Chr09g0412181 [Helianthus annuus]
MPMTKSSLKSFVAALTSVSEKRRHRSEGSVEYDDLLSVASLRLDRLRFWKNMRSKIDNKTNAPPIPPIIAAYGGFFLFLFTGGVGPGGGVVEISSGFGLTRLLFVLSLKASKPFK